MNLYVFTLNNTLALVDPTGRDAVDVYSALRDLPDPLGGPTGSMITSALVSRGNPVPQLSRILEAGGIRRFVAGIRAENPGASLLNTVSKVKISYEPGNPANAVGDVTFNSPAIDTWHQEVRKDLRNGRQLYIPGNEAAFGPQLNRELLVSGAHEAFHVEIFKTFNTIVPSSLRANGVARGRLSEAMAAVWTLAAAKKIGANTKYWRKLKKQNTELLSSKQKEWLEKYEQKVRQQIERVMSARGVCVECVKYGLAGPFGGNFGAVPDSLGNP